MIERIKPIHVVSVLLGLLSVFTVILGIYTKFLFDDAIAESLKASANFYELEKTEDELKDAREQLLQASFDRDMNQEALDAANNKGQFFAEQGNKLYDIMDKYDQAVTDYLNFLDSGVPLNSIAAFNAREKFKKAREKTRKDIMAWSERFTTYE